MAQNQRVTLCIGAVGESRVRNNTGRWTFEEHNAFLRGVELYGRTYEAVASLVPTRTVLQIRTHSQKYFAKINKGEAFPEEPYPSQYEPSAGKAGAAAGAYLYDRPQHQQEKVEQQSEDGDSGLLNSMDTGPPVVCSQREWGGRGGGDGDSGSGGAESARRYPGLLIGLEQQQAAAAAGSGDFADSTGSGAGFMMLPPVPSFSAHGSCVGGGSGVGSGSGSMRTPGCSVAPSHYHPAGAAHGARDWLDGTSGITTQPRSMVPTPNQHTDDNNNNRSQRNTEMSAPPTFSSSPSWHSGPYDSDLAAGSAASFAGDGGVESNASFHQSTGGLQSSGGCFQQHRGDFQQIGAGGYQQSGEGCFQQSSIGDGGRGGGGGGSGYPLQGGGSYHKQDYGFHGPPMGHSMPVGMESEEQQQQQQQQQRAVLEGCVWFDPSQGQSQQVPEDVAPCERWLDMSLVDGDGKMKEDGADNKLEVDSNKSEDVYQFGLL